VAVVYLMVKHVLYPATVTKYLQPPELDHMPYLPPLSPASTECYKIPRKHRNSIKTGKFHGSALKIPRSAENCGR